MSPKTKMIVTFGFINKIKNYEMLFKIYDAKRYSWLHIGNFDKNDEYQINFLKKALESDINIKFTSYLDKKDVARFLACADFCVFPFINGVPSRHATFQAALMQNSYIIATNKDKTGYDRRQNVYFILENDTGLLTKAFMFKPNPVKSKENKFINAWQKVAKQHFLFYKNLYRSK